MPGASYQPSFSGPTAVVEPAITPEAAVATEPAFTPEPTVVVEPAVTPEATLVTGAALTPEPTFAPEHTLAPEHTVDPGGGNRGTDSPLLSVDGFTFQVELADTPDEITRGLSYRESLPAGTGMLFVYPDERMRAFWMFEMRFPLDMVWIDGDCVVADITENAPAPEEGQPNSELPLFSPKVPVRYVFEINAGEAQRRGVDIGDRVVFGGSIEGEHGC